MAAEAAVEAAARPARDPAADVPSNGVLMYTMALLLRGRGTLLRGGCQWAEGIQWAAPAEVCAGSALRAAVAACEIETGECEDVVSRVSLFSDT